MSMYHISLARRRDHTKSHSEHGLVRLAHRKREKREALQSIARELARSNESIKLNQGLRHGSAT